MIDLRNIRRKLAPLKRSWYHSARKPLTENHSAKGTVVLASSGRSGSTWISRTINWNGEFREMFEPFHGRWVKEFSHHARYQYVDPNHSDERTRSAIKNVIEGRIADPWIDQYNKQRNVSKRLIKAIRANLFLPAIHHWHPESNLVLIIRHPFAQSNSAVEGNWQVTSQMFREQPALLNRYPGLTEIIDATPASPFLQSVLGWAIAHWVPLVELSEQNLKVIFYEDLFTDSQTTFRNLFDAINEPFSEEALASIEMPSRTTRHSGSISKNDPLNRWRKNVSAEDIEQGHHILNKFGLNSIYGDESVPQLTTDQCFAVARQAGFQKHAR